jgi:osmoprotectant transport system substrate-binding protein
VIRGHATRARLVALALASVLALAACGGSSQSSSATAGPTTTAAVNKSPPPAATGPGLGRPVLTIGDKNFVEEYILGELYAQALAAQGYTVNLKDNIGSSEITFRALQSGQIDMYPEYTGTLLTAVAGIDTPLKSAQQTYAAAKAWAEQRGFRLLDMTPFSDSDALGTLTRYATGHRLKTIPDLKPLGKAVKLGAPPEFATRAAGLVGLKQAYGVTPTFVALAIGEAYTALDSGRVEVSDVFTTDPQLLTRRYTVLSDPKFVFGFQNAAPLVSNKVVAAEGPEFTATLNRVSALLTLPAMQKMNGEVAVDKEDPATVARAFLAANGLL